MSEITFNGKTYILTMEAEPSSRVLPYPKNLQDVAEGEEYDFEMIAYATDEDGNRYKVSWIFSDIKGEEGRPYDDYDYSTPDDVIEL